VSTSGADVLKDTTPAGKAPVDAKTDAVLIDPTSATSLVDSGPNAVAPLNGVLPTAWQQGNPSNAGFDHQVVNAFAFSLTGQGVQDSSTDHKASVDASPLQPTGHTMQTQTSSPVIMGTSVPGTTPIDSPPNSGSLTSQLTDGIIQTIPAASGSDHASVVLRLNPPELGKVNVHVSMNNDVVNVRLVASDESARQAIDRQMNDLRQSLSNQGIALNQCHVECNTGGRQSFDQTSTWKSYDNSSDYIRTHRTSTPPSSTPTSQPASRSGLSYVA
jgi:flagellar hook-length control protein FliK